MRWYLWVLYFNFSGAELISEDRHIQVNVPILIANAAFESILAKFAPYGSG